jgi:aspartate 4-decarboxylase
VRSPDWLAATPREAFFTLGRFAVADSRRAGQPGHLGAHLRPAGIAERFAGFAEQDQPGVEFLREAVGYGVRVLGFDPDAWVLELAQGALGAHYPLPERMLSHCEEVVRAFFVGRLCGDAPPPGRFDLFATEGGRAAVGYAVQTMVANRLLISGDRIAVASSILVPYLETPGLDASGFEVVDVRADPDEDWQFPDAEIDKLAEPGIKAFYLANPAHPHLRLLRERTVDRIAAIVRRQRPDLLLISDESFGTFVEGFRSLACVLPASVVSVYSFSRHFGSTGWRLGIAALHRDNAFDRALDELPDDVRLELDRRYVSANGNPMPLRFIDRMAAERAREEHWNGIRR